MNENDIEVVKFIESIGFILDREDMIWYTSDYKQRIALRPYCKFKQSIFYDGGGFSLKYATNFTTVNDLKNLIKQQK